MQRWAFEAFVILSTLITPLIIPKRIIPLAESLRLHASITPSKALHSNLDGPANHESSSSAYE